MAKKTPSQPPPGLPQITSAQGIDLLSRQIAAGQTLQKNPTLSSDEYSAWEMLTRNFLEKAFGVNSPNVSTITNVGKYGSFPMGANAGWWNSHRQQSLATQLVKLQGLVELLKTEAQLQDTGISPAHPTFNTNGHQIFLVHGHDEGTLHETARFLSGLDQSVRILREQPNRGRTIIEKFEEYSDVGFAVVLLTPDDLGGESTSPDKQCPRARQNVVFELGYFIGHLGRNRVCALYRKGVEIPSDYAGVLFVEMDARGGWKLELAKELKAAGFPVDMNKAL